jgi:c-di-GMP-binding flagellar brake protein YcgR
MEAHDGMRQRRAYERKRMLVEVRWHHRTAEGEAAELWDVSMGGAFLSLFGVLPEMVGKNDIVWIVIHKPEQDEILCGKVRWRGFSESHGVIGLGIEFDAGSRAIAERLFGR